METLALLFVVVVLVVIESRPLVSVATPVAVVEWPDGFWAAEVSPAVMAPVVVDFLSAGVVDAGTAVVEPSEAARDETLALPVVVADSVVVDFLSAGAVDSGTAVVAVSGVALFDPS